MTKVEQILEAKGRRVFTISTRDTVRAAIRELSAHNIGALLVCEAGRVVGILSERDCVRRVMQQERSPDTTLVSSVMTSPVLSVRPGESIDKCMVVMTDQRVRHLPVIEHGHLLGMLSVGDIVKAKLAAQADAIADLERYIHGAPYSMPTAGM